MRDEAAEVIGNGTDIFGNAPFVVVEDADELFGRVPDIVERLERNAVGEGGVAKDADDVFVGALFVARRGHAQRGGKSRARVAGAVTIVWAFRAQRETVQAIGGADGVKFISAAREQFVHVNLVADVPDKFVPGRFKNTVQREGQFHDSEIRTEVAAVLGEDRYQFVTDLFGERAELIERQSFDALRFIHLLQETTHIYSSDNSGGAGFSLSSPAALFSNC